MPSVFSLTTEQIDDLTVRVKAYGDGAEDAVNEVFESYGVPEVKSSIQELIHPSNRRWKGKKASATKGNPFVHKLGNVSFIISSKSAYNYLYFPDDGSNTRRHAGNQQFMIRGAEKAAPSIIERVTAKLTEF